jgi:putative aldouronate transport system permease protein
MYINKKSMQRRKKINKEYLSYTLMSLPFVLFIFFFNYMPLFGWIFAFTNYKPGHSIKSLKFEGLKYFRYIITFWNDISNALVNTIALSLLSLLASVLPVLFALLLNELYSRNYKKLIQTVVTLPHFVSWIIIYSLCFALFSTNGMVNTCLSLLGTESKINLLGNADKSWMFMTGLDIWKNTGWNSIIYLAAIAGIDEALYDAANVDGAGRLQRIIHVTLPGMVPTFIVLMILKIGNLLNLGMEKYLLFSNTITYPKLEVLDMLTYRMGIGSQQYSFATAVGIIKSIVSILLLRGANTIAKKIGTEGIL